MRYERNLEMWAAEKKGINIYEMYGRAKVPTKLFCLTTRT